MTITVYKFFYYHLNLISNSSLNIKNPLPTHRNSTISILCSNQLTLHNNNHARYTLGKNLSL